VLDLLLHTSLIQFTFIHVLLLELQTIATDPIPLPAQKHACRMKSPPVEDMFAELSSEDGEDYVVPRRNRSKIYYSRDQLLALKNSPLVKEPQGMSPSSEWFTYAGSISALAYACITTDIRLLGSDPDRPLSRAIHRAIDRDSLLSSAKQAGMPY
jgi:hypothetical protein